MVKSAEDGLEEETDNDGETDDGVIFVNLDCNLLTSIIRHIHCSVLLPGLAVRTLLVHEQPRYRCPYPPGP